MGLSLEQKRRYPDIFWKDFHLCIKKLKSSIDIRSRFPNLKDRAIQVLIFELTNPMWSLIEKSSTGSHLYLLSESEHLSNDTISWAIKENKINISLIGRLKLLLTFIAFWSFFTLNSIRFALKSKTKKKTHLIYGVGKASYKRNGSLDSFRQFCKEGPVEAWHNSELYICQGDKNDSDGDFLFDHYPLAVALKFADLSLLEIFKLVFLQMKWGCYYLYKSFFNSAILLLCKDFSKIGVAQILNDKNCIEGVTFSQGWCQEQPLWTTDLKNRNFKSTMAWYSANSRSFKFYENQILSYHPHIVMARCDKHLVWTENEKKWLDHVISYGNVVVSGPVMFYLSENKSIFKNNNSKNIVIFDVTPCKRDLYSPSFYLYYNKDNCLKFIREILKTVERIELENNLKINLYLKPKRISLKGRHDEEYLRFLKESRIIELSPDENIFDLLEFCDGTIVVPYSSPMFILKDKNKGCYHDPTGELLDIYSGLYNHSRSETEVYSFLKKCLL